MFPIVRSVQEDELKEWLESLDYKVVSNDRKTLKSPSGHWMELDILIPKEHFAIEVDGECFHEESELSYNKWQLIMRGPSEKAKKEAKKWKGYHAWKDKQCAEKGIKLIHITYAEWVYDNPHTKARILAEMDEWRKNTT